MNEAPPNIISFSERQNKTSEKATVNSFQGVIEFPQEKPTDDVLEAKAKTETASPFFSVQRYPQIIKETIAQFGQARGEAIILQRLARDTESIIWEVTERQKPFRYDIHIKTVNGERRIIHESDLHTGQDLTTAVSPKLRRGMETKQFKKAKEMALQAKLGESILIPSAKEYLRDEKPGECIYVDSIITIMTKVEENRLETRQFLIKKDTPNFEAPQMAQLINNLVGREVVDPNAHIDDLLMGIGIGGIISTPQVWRAIEQITGQPFTTKPIEELEQEEQKFKQYSKEGAMKIYQWIKEGVVGGDLERRYTEMMKEMLTGVESGKIKRSADGGVSFSTSCGDFGLSSILRGANGGKEGDVLWCKECRAENTCNTDYCYIESCRGKLTKEKPNVLGRAA